jgi:hypothetical protein
LIQCLNSAFCSDADVVEDMLDNLQEERDIHDQIADVISRPGTEMFDDVRQTFACMTFLVIV